MTINHLGHLKPDRRNARRHNPRNIGMVETSLQTDGFGRSILLDAAGNIIAGNGVTEAAGNVGLEDVIVVQSDGTKVIAVQRTDVEPGSERAVRLAIADNRTQELSDFDPAVIAALADEVDLSDFWRDDELDALLAGVASLDFDPRSEWAGMPEFEQEDEMPVKRLIVNFKHADDVARFARLVEQDVTMTTKSIWYPVVLRAKRDHLAYIGSNGDDES